MYTSIANLQLRLDKISLAQLANDEGSGVFTAADADAALATADVVAVLEQFITDAGLYLDSILNGCLDMSVSGNQTAVEQHCTWVTLYNLHMRKNHVGGEPNPYFQQYKDAIRWAESVSKRKYHPNRDPLRPASIAYSTTSSSERVLSDDATENA